MKSIVQLIRNQIIPWTAPTAFPQRRLIVARKKMRSQELPEGVEITTRKLDGTRIIEKGRRNFGNLRFYTAFWPNDNLHEVATYKVVCVVKGVADHLHGKYSVRCKAGNFILVAPQMPNQRFGPFLQRDGLEHGYCATVCAYTVPGGVLFFRTTSRGKKHTNNASENYLIDNPDLKQLLTQAVKEAYAAKKDSTLIVNSCLTALYALGAREIEAGNYVSFQLYSGIGQSKRFLDNFAEDVQAYIRANCHKMIKVEDVASYMCISVSHFFRLMNEHHLKFTELLTEGRMEIACRLLQESNMTVNAISGRVSYKSSTYFRQVFHKYMGCTPTEYRDKSRKGTKSLK